MTNLDSILKSRDITLPTKVHLVKAMVFPVVMYGYESQTIKKAECGRIDAFELWCWRRLLRVSWTARRSNQSILKEISPEYFSLEGLMLKLKLQYFDDLMWRNSLEKTLMLRKTEGRRRRGWQRGKMVGWHHWLYRQESEQAPVMVMDSEAWRAVVHGVAKSWTWLSDWTELNWVYVGISVQFSLSIVSGSLWPHGLQHARCPCPSPTPGACSNWCIFVYSYQLSSVAQLRLTRMLTNNLCNKFNHIDEIWVEVQQVWTGNHQAYWKWLSFFLLDIVLIWRISLKIIHLLTACYG